ncbi:hypothetical protein [Pseudoduganella albidiflava]|uniref:Uncharacterized protein n=1 Tax=Pseudoduganella albidiflava TaxID=321983 RepID=A0AA87Y4X3_9BURK|nr:hypothetical protein [Pseudoduganella albidiflava]GGY68050.1 hypothetical protein GCM10007387_57790 [Pseudoduganella albidiflava]
MKTNERTVDAAVADSARANPAPIAPPEPQRGGSYLRDPVTGALTQRDVEPTQSIKE